MVDLERPENRYLTTPLVRLMTSGQLPRPALKDYAVLRWPFQAHAGPAMMLSHACFLTGQDVHHLPSVKIRAHQRRIQEITPVQNKYGGFVFLDNWVCPYALNKRIQPCKARKIYGVVHMGFFYKVSVRHMN